jgi:hypothetical protein
LTPKKEPPDWYKPFLKVLTNTANVRAAANAAGITRAGAYYARKHDDSFASEWDVALEDACDLLEWVARKRAYESSDVLLIFLLKAHRPERYADRLQVEHIVRKKAAELADRFGMTPEEVVAQAEALLHGGRR